MLIFILTTMLFGLFGLVLMLTQDYTNIGIYYYTALTVFSIVTYILLPQLTSYLSNVIMFYTLVVIFCYTIYTSQSESL